jgi:hypothetical protein
MDTGTLKWCAWSGPVLIVAFLVGFWAVAGFVPPPSPSDTATQIADFYRNNTTSIRVGLWMTMLAASLVAPWTVAITTQLRRIEGRNSPLAQVQLVLGALLVLEFIIPLMVWQAAAFRPDGDPEITQRLNDLGWLMFVGVVSTGVLQAIVIGVAILRDARDAPVFPRWVGYFNMWVALLFMPGGLCVFFKNGPFAWTGVFAWWLLLAAFTLWILVMSWVVLAYAVKHQEHEHATSPAGGSIAVTGQRDLTDRAEERVGDA